MEVIEKDIQFYDSIKSDIELSKNGKWVLIKDQELVDTYDNFEIAAEQAVKLFGRGPYLIRQIGRMPFIVPASVAFITRRNG
jgi:hypothetical protein